MWSVGRRHILGANCQATQEPTALDLNRLLHRPQQEASATGLIGERPLLEATHDAAHHKRLLRGRHQPLVESLDLLPGLQQSWRVPGACDEQLPQENPSPDGQVSHSVGYPR